jgi:hypothetical protein
LPTSRSFGDFAEELLARSFRGKLPASLLSRFCGCLIGYGRTSSSRKHVDQYRQDDEHQNGSEQDASHNDQRKRALNLRADRG